MFQPSQPILNPLFGAAVSFTTVPVTPDFGSAADTFQITARAKLGGGKAFSFPFYAALPKGSTPSG